MGGQDNPNEDVASDHPSAEEPVRVLVVGQANENEEFLKTMLGRMRLSSSLETVFLHSMADAMRVLHAAHIDVVLSEFMLPDGTSAELFAEVKKRFPKADRLVLAPRPDTAADQASSAGVWATGPAAREMRQRMEHLLQLRALSRATANRRP